MVDKHDRGANVKSISSHMTGTGKGERGFRRGSGRLSLEARSRAVGEDLTERCRESIRCVRRMKS